jgi:hypothetical protein
MNQLVKLLGPAPSEDLEAFAKRLTVERLRVSEQLQLFRETLAEPKGKGSRKRAIGPDDAEALTAMKEMGINSVEELIAKVKEAKNAANRTNN